MSEKERFVALARTGRFKITELCKDFGISRKTGHKYLKRHEIEGRSGLAERSRRPKSCPWATDGEVEKPILKERREHPTWGPKKIRVTRIPLARQKITPSKQVLIDRQIVCIS